MLELVGGVTLLLGLYFYFIISRYKRCPPDKILVVSGKTGYEDKPVIYDGGSAFVWPVLQDFAYLDRHPLKVTVSVVDALTKDKEKVDLTALFVLALGTSPSLLEAAAGRILNLSEDQIKALAKEVVLSQLRLVVSVLASVELNEQERLIDAIYVGVNKGLAPLGLLLLNVDVEHIRISSKSVTNQGTLSSLKEVMTTELVLSKQEMNSLINGKTIEVQLPTEEERFLRIAGPRPII